jgi:hypothetical protein
MVRYAKIAVAGVLSTVLAGPVWGQAAGAGAGGAKAGGQAGAGQGAGPATAGVRTSASMGGVNQTPWFSNQAVRSHLNLNDQQFNALNQAYGQAYGNYSSNLGQLGNTLTPQERAQKMEDMRAKFDQSFNTATEKYITDPQQRQRYNQLYTQYQGYNAFTNPQIQQKLNLTDQQRQQLQQAASRYYQQFNGLQQNSQANPQATANQFNTLRQQANQNINSILTPQQQQTWRQLTGDPYNFQWSDYAGGTSTNGTSSNGTR